MSKPLLLVVAGCNGAGKSSYSAQLAPDSIEPFDYDKVFLLHYKSLISSELLDRMAHNLAFGDLENSIKEAILKETDFCYETNFNSDPFYWPDIFRKSGYQVHLIFFCLSSISEAKKRVQIRVENGGHFVPEQEIEKRYFEGYANLDNLFAEFEVVHLFDSSHYNQRPEHLVAIENGEIAVCTNFPDFLISLLPKISKAVNAAKIKP